MKGGEVIRKARRMAGLTQSDVARRLGTTASVLSRWENGQVEPGFATVARAVETLELRLADVLNEPDADPHDISLLETTLAMTVDERLQRLIDYVRFVTAGREAIRAR
ncbi:MAG: helix-turn-helix domain-containing protein [Vicinamibacteraceae bacterium]